MKEEALREPLWCSVERSHAREPFHLGRLRLCRDDLRPMEMEVLCPGPERRCIPNLQQWIIKSDAEMRELVATLDSVPRRLFWGPLRTDPEQINAFLKALDGAGLLTWRRRRRAEAGSVFVPKKGSLLRLVIDVRIANACYKRPPHSAMAVPGAIACVVCSDEGFELASGPTPPPAAVQLCGSAGDFTGAL